jgi:lipoprotein NlpI
VVYHEIGKTAEALADLNRAIEVDPQLPSAYLERGKLRTEGGDFDGALADFGQLMLIRANDPDTYLHRGVCLVKKGLVDDAMADFYRVLKLTNHSDYAEPAKAYLRQVLDDRAGAMARYKPNGTPVAPLPPQARAQDPVL